MDNIFQFLVDNIKYIVALSIPVFAFVSYKVMLDKGGNKKKTLTLESGSHGIQGRRLSMEDEHIAIDSCKKEIEEYSPEFDCSFYAVYDGHRGRLASEYIAKHLHINLFNSESFKKGNIIDSFTEVFEETDEQFLEYSKENKLKDGTTAAVAVIRDNKIYVANLGDAEVIIGKLDEDQETLKPICLTKIHKPTDPDEKERITSNGGFVFNNRISGTIAISRAFGDIEYKTVFEEGDVKIGKLISSTPYVNTYDIDPENDLFMIVGCDGVWEAMSHQDSVDFVQDCLEENSIEEIPEFLCQKAHKKGSNDNISCIIVKF
eukprot:TRINITY_DN6810_c0_g1_i1.p1 TRINITY_DN6810_c0_g1~~TRINITY_DN6810_c0_g1_i1.p1  ORF type:complete len:318 (+),score=122.72 TRINITY_DN6810_c0_g1_i1:102-1055(+)